MLVEQQVSYTHSANNPPTVLTLPTRSRGSASAAALPVHFLIWNVGPGAVYATATVDEDGPNAVPCPVGMVTEIGPYHSGALPFLWASAATNCYVTPFYEVG